MNKYNIYIAQLIRFLEKRSKREYALITITGLVCIYFVLKGLVLSDLLEHINKSEKMITAKNQQLEVLLSESAKLQLALQENSKSHILKEIKEKQAILKSLYHAKSNFAAKFVSAEKMNELLKMLYVEQDDIKLIQIHNLPSKPFYTLDNQEDEALFYKHGLVIELSGNQDAILEYIQKLEGLAFYIMFESLYLDANKDNLYEATLTVYTVSEQQDWLKL